MRVSHFNSEVAHGQASSHYAQRTLCCTLRAAAIPCLTVSARQSRDTANTTIKSRRTADCGSECWENGVRGLAWAVMGRWSHGHSSMCACACDGPVSTGVRGSFQILGQCDMCQLPQTCWPCDLSKSGCSELPNDSHRLRHVVESAAHVVHRGRRAGAGVRHLPSRDRRASPLSCVCFSPLSAGSDALHATSYLSDDTYRMGPSKGPAVSQDGRRCSRVEPGLPTPISG